MAAGTPVALSVSVFDAMMKEIYPDIRVESLAVKNRPLLEWMPKSDTFYGDTYVVPVLYEDPQGRSAAISDAINDAETSQQEKFVITARRKDYGVVKIEAEAIMAASKDVGAFIKAKDTQISGMLRQLGKSLHLALYRAKSGSIGRLASSGSMSVAGGNTTVTLTNPSDAYNFGRGQTVYTSTADGGGSTKTAAKVLGRSVANGTILIEGDATGFGSAWANSDYLFTKGDYDVRPQGLAAWIPLTAPSATTFFGVDRTKDMEALSGHRVNNTGRSILENAEELAMRIGEFGGEPDTLFLNPRAGLQLSQQVQAKIERTDGGVAKVGFTGFTLNHFVTGPIDVRFDIGCPPDLGYMLQRDTWEFAHMGPVPHLVRDDGRDSLRGSSTDDIEVRGRYFGELCCYCPGKNGVMAVATS